MAHPGTRPVRLALSGAGRQAKHVGRPKRPDEGHRAAAGRARHWCQGDGQLGGQRQGRGEQADRARQAAQTDTAGADGTLRVAATGQHSMRFDPGCDHGPP